MSETAVLHFPQDEVEERVRYVLSVIPALGRSVLSYQQSLSLQESESAETDYRLMKTAEGHAETALIEALRSRFAKDWLDADEAGELPGDNDFRWFIDALDGTRNYVHGSPLFATAIGLCFRGTPVAGVVQAPALGDVYHAIYGNGAVRNGKPIRVSSVDSVARSIIATGLPYHREKIINELIADISAFISSGTGLRRSGSAALDLCWVADARYDAFWEAGLPPHDLCASSVILSEARGRLSGLQGQPFHIAVGDVIASNDHLHNELLQILRDSRKVEGLN
ncbi:MAG: inositol monophosphatase [Spirochaetales bacterium]|nr:inositol monophosphatase [Leptospiraceae bacterium]MCP5482368.1 inositol monophosphatase [Spirochaetales bacterium]MCP5484193.1 inositol monophosphatase [Spirochaetales bacterium]